VVPPFESSKNCITRIYPTNSSCGNYFKGHTSATIPITLTGTIQIAIVFPSMDQKKKGKPTEKSGTYKEKEI
ncbi:8234_t:CDS:2, partial [Gigaspora rosea]